MNLEFAPAASDTMGIQKNVLNTSGPGFCYISSAASSFPLDEIFMDNIRKLRSYVIHRYHIPLVGKLYVIQVICDLNTGLVQNISVSTEPKIE
jgi:hypothetical protein